MKAFFICGFYLNFFTNFHLRKTLFSDPTLMKGNSCNYTY